MAKRPQLIGPLPNVGARRVVWDRGGRFALTLADDDRLLGLSPEATVFEAQAEGAVGLLWDPTEPLLAVLGQSLLIDGTGRARVGPEGAELALSPSGRFIGAHLADDDRYTITDHTGSAVASFTGVIDVEWASGSDRLLMADQDGVSISDLSKRWSIVSDQDGGTDYASWSPQATSMVVWGTYGSFDVRTDSGELLMSFPAHTGSVNLAASLGSTLLATSGDDCQVVLYDLVRRGIHGRIDLPCPAVDLSFDPTERLLTVSSLDDRTFVVDTSDLEFVENAGPDTGGSAWSPYGSVLARCDGADLWLEEFN